MSEEPTCGQGLAEHAMVHQLIAAFINATADNLVTHLPMLSATDADTQLERSVYEQLSTRHRDVAVMLDAIGTEMKQHQHMRMGQHEAEAMSQEDMTKALKGMVLAEEQLVAQLERQLTEHRAMVDELAT